ncbi:alpha/beta hydrolase family protein [Georgenia subflava]|uniref:Prolyl oligopeptidase family serine peptidase n=1 Tax=Georgenia subflava TaxID=1622177 RepID=A0A6N7EGC9_9MICO|nr:prolyl oligopeptidase family serine peptidase [Georgenia subflava]MPV36451.1 prolyl oligopeptidase family serine peptidase [Georgenia subflava]
MEREREWWTDRLGAVPDPRGGWDVGPERPADDPAPRTWREQDIVLHSHGSDLTATLLSPGRPGAPATPGPAVVVPFYDVAAVLGRPSARTHHAPPVPGNAFAPHLAAHGLAVLAVPWWFEAVVPPDAPRDLAGRYGPPAERHRVEQPMTALGRSVGDLMLAVDALRAQPSVDPDRIGVLGHSLGGKLALHLTALDRRVAAGVAHEPGLGLAHSNWDAPWYLGDRVPRDRDLDEVLALVAPRPFLLVGGGDSDGEHNRDLVERARRSWEEAPGLDVLQHDGGHPVPAHVQAACVTWLRDRLGPGV